MICQFCAESIDRSDCARCLVVYRYNYDLLVILIFFFSLPSIFIIKGTGNFYYLLTALIGFIIYLFNIKKVRDEEATYRSYIKLMNESVVLDNYLAGSIGVVELVGDSELARISLQQMFSSDLYRLSQTIDTMTVRPAFATQIQLLGPKANIEDINADVIKISNKVKERLSCFKQYHNDLIEKFC